MKRVMTVLGEIAPQQLGITMPHEHVACDISRDSGREDNLLDDIGLLSAEVAAFKSAGGRTMVDVTTADIGRNPTALKTISENTGVHLITTVGYYSEKLFINHVAQHSTASLAADMIREIRHGINHTNIKPGIIGELRSTEAYVTPGEERVLRAGARAHNETGLAITLHSSDTRPAPNQIAVLREEGVSLERVIVGHADVACQENMADDLDYYLPLLDAGCYLAFDTIGWPGHCPEPEIIARIIALTQRGYGGRLLISSDVCRRSFLHANGGRGYDYVLRHFVPMARAHGLDNAQIQRMLIDNPREVLSF